MFCPKCGKQIPEGGRFCGACGAAVQQSVPKNPPKPQKSPKPAKPPKPPREKKKLPLKKILIPMLCLVLVAAVIFGVSALFGKKTVYLVSRRVTENATMKQTEKTEYDEQGRIVSIKTTTKYTNTMSGDNTMLKEYTFDDDGKLVGVEVSSGGESIELEYNYDKKGHLESIECDDREAEVECDKDGRVTEIAWEDGSIEYSYFKSGALKEIELDYNIVSYNYVYDEDGHMLEQTTSIDGEKLSTAQMVYDKNGRLVETTTFTYTDGKRSGETTFAYLLDNSGLPEQITLSSSIDGTDVTVYMKSEDDGLRREFHVVDIDADKDLLEKADAEDVEEMLEMLDDELDGEPFMVLEYDKHGNMLESSTTLDISKTTTEYTAVKVPRDYRKPNQQGPLYFLPPIF